MIISVASGKGGVGKTTLAASLLSVWDAPAAAVDLDVEEPNLHLFLRPEIASEEAVFMEIPLVDETKCTRCGACVEICRFKALAMLGDILMPFPEMCHGCGGCLAVCPEKALSIGKRELGVLMRGRTNGNEYFAGRLRVGEAMSPPLMREVKRSLSARLADASKPGPVDAVIDAPPGVSCPAVNAVMDSDYILLVTEPTPFGLYDFSLAFEAFSPLGKPMGAVINRSDVANAPVREFCRAGGLPILAEIPFDRAVAEGYARGRLAVEARESLRETFEGVRDAARAAVANAAREGGPCAR